jgi:TRAP-type C4-dicarboxylate transport system permease small subunit
MRALWNLHDTVTRLSFQLAVACLGIIAVAFCYEVVARYAFNAPTVWANPLVSYLLCALIFLALPEMTRTGQHININILIDAVPPATSHAMASFVRLIGCAACLLGAWITGVETRDQIMTGVQTISFLPIPKWWISIFIPYGMLSAGLYFLRQLLGGRPAAPATGVGA